MAGEGGGEGATYVEPGRARLKGRWVCGGLTKPAHSLCILAGSRDGAEGANHFKL